MNDQPINDGGPAFPAGFDAHERAGGRSGMTLRDWFAGMALMASVESHGFLTGPKELAAYSYSVADAMLAARKEASRE